MKYIQQFLVLVSVSFIGEVLHRIIPLPIPASIYGLVLMFCALQFKIMPLKAVEETADYIISIMPLLFIPSTVGLMVAWPVLKMYWLQFILIGIFGTIVVFFVTGHVTQLVIRLLKKKSIVTTATLNDRDDMLSIHSETQGTSQCEQSSRHCDSFDYPQESCSEGISSDSSNQETQND